MAMTLDGKVMRPDGRWHGLTSAGDRHRMDLYRNEADALIVGSRSVAKDDPVVVPKFSEPGRRPPVPVMICRNELPSPERRMFQQQDVRPLLLLAAALEADLGPLADRCDVELFSEGPSPADALTALAGRGYRRILLEGGPRLNWAFFAADLVDVLYLTLVPYIIGQSDLPAIVDGAEPFDGFDVRHWDLHRAHTIGREIFFEYRRVRQDSAE